LSQSFRHGKGSIGKRIELEYTHRTIPDNTLRLFNGFNNELYRLGSDIHTDQILGNICRIDLDYGGIFLELCPTEVIYRKDYLYTPLFCFCQEGSGSLLIFFLNQTLADAVALHGKEGVSHAAADYDGIAGAYQTLKHADLAGDLRTTDDGDKRLIRILKKRSHELHFLLNQETGIGRKIVCNTLGGSMCTVGRTKSIVDIHITESSQTLCKFRIIRLFFSIETYVLKQQYVTFL